MTSTTTDIPTLLYRRVLPTPVGVLTLIGGDSGLRAVLWPEERARRVTIDEQICDGDHPVLTDAQQQLSEYFEGSRTTFDLTTDPRGTEFQRRAWKALVEIPYGTTSTYGEQAARMGTPSAVRAVGAANGRNPLSIVVPCHRVVGASGSLTGFAGGLDAKRLLLDLESATNRLPL